MPYILLLFIIIAKCLSARHLIAHSGQGCQQALYVRHCFGMQLILLAPSMVGHVRMQSRLLVTYTTQCCVSCDSRLSR